ncbi:Extracellular protein [Penicillium maclennaniae]|uniref:Extracellular protein n=1 Tax=Penicillium maclennaniae TaxID=1343394 RepID=UPI002541D0B8|nr:Extracellular protein [Penicillium maclennaniae]KAJ5682081.1 Extracellular protein [Penicillium maclennaniae]
MKSVAFVAGLLATSASAHMQMSKPYPIRSPLNPNSDAQKDYSYTNPLQSSGSDYPCKGYANDKFDSQATYAQGQQYEMELEGSATHGGGSCQISLTYDRGKTFKVIESMLGNCPIDKKYNFTVPSDAPSGEALLAWTWFNKVGNREMYMNCAFVTIGGNSKGKKVNRMQQIEHAHEAHVNHPAMEHASHPNAQPKEQRDIARMETQSKVASFDSLPAIFVANVNQEGKCVTIEGEPVNFPKPGNNVVGEASGKGYKCSGDAPFLGASDSISSTSTSSTSTLSTSTLGTSASSTSDSNAQATKNATDNKETITSKQAKTTSASTNDDHSKTIATRSDKGDQSISKVASAFGTPSAVVSTEAATNNAFSSYVSTGSCHDGEVICSPDGYSWAMCSNNKPVFMGSVAAGMSCRLGQMVRAS